MTIEEVIKSTIPLPLSRKTVLNLVYTQNVLFEYFSGILKAHGLSSEQYNVLRILRGQKGKPVNMGAIQERMLAKSSNTTRLVDKLLAKKLVERNVCPDNRRKMEVLITAKGLEILEQLDPEVNRYEERFAANLTQAELDQLNQLLEKFRTL